MALQLTQWCSSENPGNSCHRWPPTHAAIFPVLDRKGRTYKALKCPACWQLWFVWHNSTEYMQLVKSKEPFYKQHKSNAAQWHMGSRCFWFEFVSEHEWQGVKYLTHVQSLRKSEKPYRILKSQSMKWSLTIRLKSKFKITKIIPIVVLQNEPDFLSLSLTHSLEFMCSHGPTLTVQLIPGQTLQKTKQLLKQY